MSGSFESVRGNACVHRLNLGLYSHPNEFWGNGVRARVNSKGKKSPYRINSPKRKNGSHDTASSRTASPTYYQEVIPAPFTSSTSVSTR